MRCLFPLVGSLLALCSSANGQQPVITGTFEGVIGGQFIGTYCGAGACDPPFCLQVSPLPIHFQNFTARAFRPSPAAEMEEFWKPSVPLVRLEYVRASFDFRLTSLPRVPWFVFAPEQITWMATKFASVDVADPTGGRMASR